MLSAVGTATSSTSSFLVIPVEHINEISLFFPDLSITPSSLDSPSDSAPLGSLYSRTPSRKVPYSSF
ncbi:hypothetical protein BCR33DRAFT_715475 [Rhizoclosmatium globosum]|uniref:Uncharacterized protein n=1 Tax=Rhizoclosmatium globosum TaxID=329046 RepID=A0A1Y2CHG7_9FUNG|nr:hypothetical protein BCR33DRAFT_715475 [Rhizoclosmatium globosum]|eukprot:ORY46357.1 hypothetical protein BCR33DRAFT_715475 [Rhizoclosmatium globosum]